MKTLGHKIKTLRKERGLTLQTVSRQAGIDVATLSRIENGKMTGTIQSHMAIAKVLGVRLPDLYEVIESEANGKKSREQESAGVFSHSGGSVSELLTSNVLHKKMMPVRLKLKPGSKTETEELPLGTERFVFVLSGKIEVVSRGSSTAVPEGEGLYFNAALPHHFVNKLKAPSTCLIVTSPVSL